MTFSRKAFLSTTAAGAYAAGVVAASGPARAAGDRAPIHFHIVKPSEFDSAAMLQKLSVDSPNKQVFQSVDPIVLAPGIASLFLHMQNSMNAYEFSLGLGKLTTLGVLIGPSIVLGLNDAMWAKYNFAKNLGISDLAPNNAYYKAGSLEGGSDPDAPNNIYQDWSAEAVIKRGGQFFVCHNATTAMAFVVSMKMGLKPEAVLDEFSKNLLPGFQMVPAGVAAVNQAQQHGWCIYPII